MAKNTSPIHEASQVIIPQELQYSIAGTTLPAERRTVNTYPQQGALFGSDPSAQPRLQFNFVSSEFVDTSNSYLVFDYSATTNGTNGCYLSSDYAAPHTLFSRVRILSQMDGQVI